MAALPSCFVTNVGCVVSVAVAVAVSSHHPRSYGFLRPKLDLDLSPRPPASRVSRPRYMPCLTFARGVSLVAHGNECAGQSWISDCGSFLQCTAIVRHSSALLVYLISKRTKDILRNHASICLFRKRYGSTLSVSPPFAHVLMRRSFFRRFFFASTLFEASC